MNAIFNTILGAILAIATTIIIELLRKPKISVEIIPPIDKNYTDYREAPATLARYSLLSIKNEELPWIFRWISRNPAINTSCLITFHHIDDGQEIFGKSMSVRWSNSTELPSAIVEGKIIDYDYLNILHHRDIHPGDSEPINVATRFDSDIKCYGWCNDNYLSTPIWRNPSWELYPGRYIVKLEIRASGKKKIDHYRLCNDGPIESFRIIQCKKEDIEKIKQWVT